MALASMCISCSILSDSEAPTSIIEKVKYIAKINTDGSQEQIVSEGNYSEVAWSPNGEHIAVIYTPISMSYRWYDAKNDRRKNWSKVGPYTDGNTDIFLMDKDGQNTINITQNTNNETSINWIDDDILYFKKDRTEMQYQRYFQLIVF